MIYRFILLLPKQTDADWVTENLPLVILAKIQGKPVFFPSSKYTLWPAPETSYFLVHTEAVCIFQAFKVKEIISSTLQPKQGVHHKPSQAGTTKPALPILPSTQTRLPRSINDFHYEIFHTTKYCQQCANFSLLNNHEST